MSANTLCGCNKESTEQLLHLLKRAKYQLNRWSVAYGENNPAWLPPAGDVRLLEDIDEVLPSLTNPKIGM